jgi:V/A-type H+/Na+-transporting ATPase subunit C
MSALPDVGPGARDDAGYAAACGRVRALEKRLLGPGRLEDLLGARDCASLLQALARFGVLARSVSDLAAGWEQALDLSGAEADRLLLSIDPQPTVSRILVMRADLVNLRSLMRSRALGVPYTGAWHTRALLERPALEAMERDGNYAAWPEPLGRRLAALHRLSPRGLPEINDELDAAWLGALREGALHGGSRFFLDWLGHAADLGNIRALLRRAAAPTAWPRALKPLPGGHLGEDLFSEKKPAALSLALLARTVYAPVLAQAGDGLGGVSPALLERAADDFLTRLLQPTRYLSLGPEPLWAWHLAREIDAKNVRTLILGNLAGIAPQRLRTLLRLPHGA